MVGMEDGRDCCDHLKPCRKYHYNNFIFKPLTFEELLGPTKQLCYRIMFLEIFELVFVSIVGDFALKKKKKDSDLEIKFSKSLLIDVWPFKAYKAV